MEPQWNPAVEDQAIARVIRMGQKRKVTIVRYVVKGTVEEVRSYWRCCFLVYVVLKALLKPIVFT